MSGSGSVACARLALPQLASLSDGQRQRLLGLTCIGQAVPAPPELPVQHVAAPLLGGDGPVLGELWQAAGECRAGAAEGIRFRADDQVLYGVLETVETDFPGGAESPLQAASRDAYERLFRLLDREGYPHLWRAWNYLAGINAESHGLERYRQFNVGRQDAFLASGRLEAGRIPAASALGVAAGPLAIAFMAGRSAPVPLENPRQVRAYEYPGEYGPRSPTFSRAALAHLPGQELLFVSGTASIVGHRTVHLGDVAGQTRESIANIAAVLEEANRLSWTGPYGLGELGYRAYVRHAADHGAVRAVVEELIGPSAPVVYVQADICRADLLVELEAMASHAMGNC